MFVSVAGPAEAPRLPGPGPLCLARTGQTKTTLVTYHWPRLIGALWSESRSHVPAGRRIVQPQSKPLLHHVSEGNHHWILSGLEIFEYFFH